MNLGPHEILAIRQVRWDLRCHEPIIRIHVVGTPCLSRRVVPIPVDLEPAISCYLIGATGNLLHVNGCVPLVTNVYGAGLASIGPHTMFEGYGVAW